MGILIAIYILVWPIVAAAVLYVICSAFWREWRDAKEHADDLV